MTTIISKNIDSAPDETRRMPNGAGEAHIVEVDGTMILQGTLEPGWRWSNDLKAVMGTDSCQFAHTGIMLAGTLHIEMDDGTTADLTAGDVYSIPPGHDAWVVGDVQVRSVDWTEAGLDMAHKLDN